MTNNQLYENCMKSKPYPMEAFDKLKDSGMLWELFPNAPHSWGELLKEMEDEICEICNHINCHCHPDWWL